MRALVVITLLFQWLHACVLGAILAQEGNGNITGYGGTLYTAHKYRPICGLLAKGRFDQDFDILTNCQPAMNQYHKTSDTFSLYSLTGLRLSDTLPIGADTDLCMCFSLADLDGKQSDICIYVLQDGTTSDYIDNQLAVYWGTGFAIGSFKFGRKNLPACFDINYDEVVASIDAAGDATHVQVEPSQTSTVSTTASPSSSETTRSQTTSSSQDDSSNATPNTSVS
jgi:hypothetical protein